MRDGAYRGDLFAVATLRGVRARFGGVIVAVLLGRIVFMAVGNSVYGFPWEGCVGQNVNGVRKRVTLTIDDAGATDYLREALLKGLVP